MKKKSSPGRDGSRGSNNRSRPATGRVKFTRNDNSGDRPARSEKKSPWDSFDNDRPSRGERSAESGERRAPFTRGRSSSGDSEKRPYQRREEGGESRAPFTRGRSDSNDGEKRPYKRRDENGEDRAPFSRGREDRAESGESRAPFTRGRSDSNDGEKRPYKRRDENENSERPYKKRDKSGPPSREDRHSRFEEKSSFRDRPSYGKSGGRRGAPRKRSASTGDDLTGEIRLNRFIGMAGICSRREADDLITAGVISVNGQVATELGMKVKPGDDIRYNGERIRNEKHVYLLLNKPKDYITTSDDPNDRKTVMELIAGACPERVYPVGRLDRNTVGLLLFTNDGDLARHLTHPSSRVKKVYQAELDKNFKVSDARRLQEGVELEDGISSVDEISIGNAKDDKKVVGVELHSGKNRIVRRMFEALGYDVVKLDRVGFAGLTKKDLPRGRWRMLDEREVGFLKMMGNGKKKQASE